MLATDIERKALLEEEEELLREDESDWPTLPPPPPPKPPAASAASSSSSSKGSKASAAAEEAEKAAAKLAKACASLLKAAKEDEYKKIDEHLANGADINHVGESGHRAVHMAAAFGACNALRLLHARGADMSAPNAKGSTPLEVARSIGEPEAAALVEALVAGTALPRRVKTEEDAQDELERQSRLAEIHERLAEIDADAAPGRAASILSGLGFTSDAQQQPTRSFSGGWRMRVAKDSNPQDSRCLSSL